MITLKAEFNFGEVVYLKHDELQLPRIVVDIEFNGSPFAIKYWLRCGNDTNAHYEFEITRDRNLILATGSFNDTEDN